MNTLVMIVFLGDTRCYLNVSEEEALKRWQITAGKFYKNKKPQNYLESLPILTL